MLIVGLATTVTACAAGGGGQAAPSPSSSSLSGTPSATASATASASPTAGATTASPGQELTLAEHCTDAETGMAIDYPTGWHTNDGAVLPTCRLFDPQRITIESGTEIPLGIDVSIQVSDASLTSFTRTRRDSRLIDVSHTTVAGHPAVTVTREGTGGALLAKGQEVYRWVVDLGDRRLVASTYEVGQQRSFARRRGVLDAMVATMDLPAPFSS